MKEPGWMFSVPNNRQGRAFLKSLSKFLNKDDFTCRKFGRPTRAAFGFGRPVENPTHFQVYMQVKRMIWRYEDLCPSCKGDYLKQEYTKDWRITKVCNHCVSGTSTHSLPVKLSRPETIGIVTRDTTRDRLIKDGLLEQKEADRCARCERLLAIGEVGVCWHCKAAQKAEEYTP